MPIVPLFPIFLFTKPRLLYFGTQTTIPTNNIVKILILAVSVFIGLNFSKILNYLLTKISFVNQKIYRILPTLTFIILVFIPNILAEFKFELPEKLIYNFLRVSYLHPPFADLRTVIYGIKCDTVNQVGDLITCDPRNSPLMTWSYPSVLLKLRFASFMFENVTLIVFLISIFLATCIFIQSLNLSPHQNLFFSSLIFSPPFLLCFGRLNFDLLIIWIIWCGIYLLKSKSRLLKNISWILFATAGLLKFYGFAAFISIFHNSNLKKFLFPFSIFFIGLAMINVDIPHLKDAVGKDIYGSIGFSVLAAQLNGSPKANLDFQSFGSIFLITYILIYVRLILKKNNFNKTINEDYSITLVFGFIFLFTWFTASNYYYRLLLLTPILLIMIKNKSSVFENFVIASTFFSFFTSPKVFGSLQNLFLLPMVCYLISKLLMIFYIEIKRIRKSLFKST